MIDFEGVTRLESIGGGCVRAHWNHATSTQGVESYAVHIRAENADVFQDEFLWTQLPYREDMTNAILRTEADSNTYFRNDITYYIGMKAIESTTQYISSTENIKAVKVMGDGSMSIEAPDRKIAKIV